MLELTTAILDEIVAGAYDAYPYESCGLLAGSVADTGTPARARSFHSCRNVAESARVYTLDPLDHLRAERTAESSGWEIIGVVHSHTHSEPYPSPTDVAQAPDPAWQYVIVSLKRESPEIRTYRIVGGGMSEDSIVVV